MPSPELSVIIVSFNTRELLCSCLRSLARVSDDHAIEVIVVDNASGDGSAEAVEAEFPEVRLVRLPRNVGFAAGMNAGIEVARGEYLFVLNPDTVVPPRAIPVLLDFLHSHPRIAIAGAGLTDPDGTPQSSSFAFPSLFREFLNFLPELKSVLRPRQSADFVKRLLGRSSNPAGRFHPPYPVECASGAAFMARADAIRQVGGFDDEFFLYHEEMDLCRRVLNAGWEIFLVPEAQIIHWGAQATGYRTEKLPHLPVLEWRLLGMDRLWRKHTPPARHRRWLAQAKGLLRLRIGMLSLLVPFSGRKATSRRERIAEFRRVVTLLSREIPVEERHPVGRTA